MAKVSKKTSRRKLQFSVAVLEPEYSINLGYLARAMANFGLKQLYIVGRNGTSKIDLNEAERYASHGSYVLKTSKRVDSLSELRNMFRFVVGTTAIRGNRKSNLTRKTLDVEKCAQNVKRLLEQSRKNQLCLLFGRDTTGLTNEELQNCDFTATIDTASEYNTLNLSHAAAIILYLFTRAFRRYGKESSRFREASFASPSLSKGTRKERERVVRLYEDLAASSDFQKFKRGKLGEALSRLMNRSDPSLREIYLLMGLASKARSKIERLSRMAKA